MKHACLFEVGSEAAASDYLLLLDEAKGVVIAVKDEADNVFTRHLRELAGENVLSCH